MVKGKSSLDGEKRGIFLFVFFFFSFFFKVIRLMKGFMIGVIENVRVRWAGHVD